MAIFVRLSRWFSDLRSILLYYLFFSLLLAQNSSAKSKMKHSANYLSKTDHLDGACATYKCPSVCGIQLIGRHPDDTTTTPIIIKAK